MADYTLSAEVRADTSDFTSALDNAQAALGELGAQCRAADDAASASDGAMGELQGNIRKVGDNAADAHGKTGGFSGGLRRLGDIGMGAAVEIGRDLVSAVADLGGEMVAASDSAEKFRNSLDFAGLDAGTIDQLVASTQAYADKTVYDLADIRNATAQLAANGVDDYAAVAEAAGNLNSVAGGNADTFRSVSQALSQTAGAGKLTAENWNQLTDAIPGASGALRQAMRDAGAFEGDFREAMSNGEISAAEFADAVKVLGMGDEAREAAQSTSTIEGALGNLEASVVGVGSQALDALKPIVTDAMGWLSDAIGAIPDVLAEVGEAVGPTFEPIADAVEGVQPAFSQMFDALGGLADSVLPVLGSAFDAFAPVVADVGGKLAELGGTVAEAVTPVLESLSDFVQAVLPILEEGWQTFGETVQGVVDAVFPWIQQVIETCMGVIQGVIDTVTAVIQGDWGAAWENVKNLAGIVWQGIQDVIGGAIEAVEGVIDSVLQGIKSIWDNAWGAIKDACGQAWEGIKQGASDGVNAVCDFVAGLPGRLVDLFAGAGSWLIESGRAILDGLAQGIRDGISGAVNAVKGALDTIRGYFPFSPAKRGPFSGHGYTTWSGRALMGDFGASIREAAPVAVRATGDALAAVQSGFARVAVPTAPAPVVERRAAGQAPDAVAGYAAMLDVLGVIAANTGRTADPREFRRAVMACG